MKFRVISSFVIATAIVIATSILSKAWRKTHNDLNTIKVTGLSQKDFSADLIVWKGSFSQRAFTLKEAYQLIKADVETVKNYFTQKGIQQNEIVFASVIIDKTFNNVYNDQGSLIRQDFTGYLLTQNVQIESNAVDKVEKVSREITELIDSGIEFNSFQPEYFYTKLSELKLDLLSNATKDGYDRAKNIAENAENSIGELKSANMGIFQITAQNSAEDYSWGGTFNTSSKRKTASITVKLEFEIK
jgi:hypothetical protein